MVDFHTDTFPTMIAKWKAAFEPVLVGDTAACLERLGGLRIGDESVSEFITIFQKALHDVGQRGISLENSVVTSFFLNGICNAFPVLYGNFILRTDNPSLEVLFNAVKSAELHGEREGTSKAAVYVAETTTTAPSTAVANLSVKKIPFKGYCDNCGKYGHKMRDCWQPGGGKERGHGHFGGFGQSGHGMMFMGGLPANFQGYFGPGRGPRGNMRGNFGRGRGSWRPVPAQANYLAEDDGSHYGYDSLEI